MASAGQTRRWSVIARSAAVMTVSVTLGPYWPLLAIVLKREGVRYWSPDSAAAAWRLSGRMGCRYWAWPCAPCLCPSASGKEKQVRS